MGGERIVKIEGKEGVNKKDNVKENNRSEKDQDRGRKGGREERF